MPATKETSHSFTGATPETLAKALLRPVQSHRHSSENPEPCSSEKGVTDPRPESESECKSEDQSVS